MNLDGTEAHGLQDDQEQGLGKESVERVAGAVSPNKVKNRDVI